MERELHDLKVEQRSRLDIHGDPYRVNVYTYYLGKNGPFSFELPLEDSDAEEVHAQIEQQAAMLRAIGALPPADTY